MIRRTWKFFCSVKLTIVLFALILIPSVVGTIVQQNAPDPASYVEVYGAGWDRVFRFLGFYDIYRDPRFVVLLVMLGLNTFACTVNRFRPKWNIVGTLMTHVGLLLILLGAVAGATLGVKGFMAIGEGETLSEISVGRATREMAPLPFEVRLLDFILEMQEEPSHRLYVADTNTGKQYGRPLKQGKVVALDEPRWAGVMSLLGIKPEAEASVVVDRILAGATISASLTEGPEQTGMQAVEVLLKDGAMELRAFAISGAGRPYVPGGTHLGIYYTRLDSADQIETALEEAAASTKESSRLEVTMPDGALISAHATDVGTKFKIESYAVEVLRYVPDLVILDNNRVGSRTELPHNPALQVRTTDPEGATTEQWLFVKYPSMHEAEESFPFELKFVRESRSDDAVDHVFILNAPGANPVAAHVRNGKLVEKSEVAPGGSISIEGTGLELFTEAFYENANVKRELEEVDVAAGGRPAVELTLTQGGEQSSHLLWADTPVDVPGYRMVYGQDRHVKDYFSVLQIVDGGEVVLEKKIEVNDPLRYGGYTFYQSSYDSEGLTWSGLQVRNDPGVPLVYVGFLVQLLGMIVIFYINPLIRKAKRARS